MVEKVNDRSFFHVARSLPYNPNSALEVGQILDVGYAHNPFFGFYQNEITFPVDTNEGQIHCKAIKFLSSVRDGAISCPTLAEKAHSIAQHYLMLTRELIMEEVRRDVAKGCPSRQSCLWVVETSSEAEYWRNRLGGLDVKIVELVLNGTIHKADAGWLLGDSEPLSKTYKNAKSYWLGEVSDRPELEILFEGKATVRQFF